MSSNRGVRPQLWRLRDGRTTAGARPAVRRPAQPVRQRAARPGAGPAGDDRRRRRGRHPRARRSRGDLRAAVATKSVAIVDLSAASPRYKRGGVAASRAHAPEPVLLPDRTVLANGGAAVEEHRSRPRCRPSSSTPHATLDRGGEVARPASVPLGRAAHARRPRDHRRLQPRARDGGVADRGLLAAVPVPAAPGRAFSSHATTPPTAPPSRPRRLTRRRCARST